MVKCLAGHCQMCIFSQTNIDSFVPENYWSGTIWRAACILNKASLIFVWVFCRDGSFEASCMYWASSIEPRASMLYLLFSLRAWCHYPCKIRRFSPILWSKLLILRINWSVSGDHFCKRAGARKAVMKRDA